jgi:hypothetical protein
MTTYISYLLFIYYIHPLKIGGYLGKQRGK